MGETRNAYKILAGKPEGRLRRKWEVDIKMYGINLVEWCRLYLSGSGQGPAVGSCKHSNEP
jgi:hypothetical protein